MKITASKPIMNDSQTMLRRFALLTGVGLMFWAANSRLQADDWPRWRGSNLDGISKETGWSVKWPEGGPKRLWEASVGVGYSSMAVSQGRLHTMGNVADKDIVFCLDAVTGKEIWKHEYACEAKDPNGYHGTRGTPTVDGDRVYTLSRHGHFFCLDAKDGKVIWSKDFKADYGAPEPRWGYAASALIEKDWVVMEVGGTNGASVVAFEKATGKEVWKNGNDGAGYSSLIAFDLNGERLMAVFCKDFFVVRKMKDGSEVARIPWKTSYGVNAATPIIEGDQIFISSGYNFGCALLKLTSNGLTEVWRNKNMRNHVNSCVLWKGCLYGYDEKELKCLDFKTGEVKWSTPAYGKGAVTFAGDKMILYGQAGKLGVAEISSEAFKEIASAQLLEGKDTWANPVLANGLIYCRSLEKLVCVEVK